MSPTPLTTFDGVITGRPIAWARTTTTPGGKRLTPARYREFKANASEVVAALARWRGFTPDTEVSLLIDIHPDGIRVRAQALDPDDRRRPNGVSGDIDNYAKAILDSLQAARVLHDDKAVAALEVRFNPRPITEEGPA